MTTLVTLAKTCGVCPQNLWGVSAGITLGIVVDFGSRQQGLKIVEYDPFVPNTFFFNLWLKNLGAQSVFGALVWLVVPCVRAMPLLLLVTRACCPPLCPVCLVMETRWNCARRCLLSLLMFHRKHLGPPVVDATVLRLPGCSVCRSNVFSWPILPLVSA